MGRNLRWKDHPVPTLCFGQGCHPLDQIWGCRKVTQIDGITWCDLGLKEILSCKRNELIQISLELALMDYRDWFLFLGTSHCCHCFLQRAEAYFSLWSFPSLCAELLMCKAIIWALVGQSLHPTVDGLVQHAKHLLYITLPLFHFFP